MKLLTNEKTFIVQPSLACAIGVEEALLLQHLHYRLQQQEVLHNGEAWYCQSHANWTKQLPFWNEQKIKRLMLRLEKLGIVHSTDKFNQFYVDRTKWYKIDYDYLQTIIVSYEQQQLDAQEKIIATMPTTLETKPEARDKKAQQKEQFSKQIDQVLNYLNDKAHKRFNIKSQANRKYVSARLKEGYTVEDCMLVVDEQVKCWGKDLNMEKYLRPMTLFRPANFDSYLSSALVKKEQQTTGPQPFVLNFEEGEDW